MKILKYSGYSFAVVVAFLVVVHIIHKWPMAFDKEVWLNSDKINQKPYPRLKMAHDLIKKDVLIGLTKSQVIELLGEPGDHGYFQSYDLVYWLGPERSFMGIDSEWLAILINDNGLVSKVTLVRDKHLTTEFGWHKNLCALKKYSTNIRGLLLLKCTCHAVGGD